MSVPNYLSRTIDKKEEIPMGIWLFRAGKRGQFEEKFLADGRIYLTWNQLNIDLNQYKNRERLLQKLQETI